MTHAELENLWDAAQAEWANACGGPMEYQIFGRMVAQEAARQEREACAKLVEALPRFETNVSYDVGVMDEYEDGEWIKVEDCAAAIRARSAASPSNSP